MKASSLAVTFFTAGVAAAGEETEEGPAVEELFLGDVAFTQDAMELQVSSSPRIDAQDAGTLLGIPIEIELGITDRLQLAATALPQMVLEQGGRSGGLSAASFEVMYGLLRDNPSGLTLSAGLEGTLPLAPPVSLEPSRSIESFVCAYRSFGPVHANLAVGGELEEEREAEEPSRLRLTPQVSGGLLFPVGPIVPTLELLVEMEDSMLLGSAIGVVWRALEPVQLGVAAYIQGGDGDVQSGGFLSVNWEFDLSTRPSPTEDDS